MPKLAAALHTLGVPVRVAIDIDALSLEDTIQKLVTALGGNWTELKVHWKVLNSAVLKGVKPKSADEIRADILSIISNNEGLPKSKITEAMKADSSWNIIKNSGKSAIPKGQAYAAYDKLDSGLRNLGIYLVPTGQIEGFLPSVGSHGPSFVSSALKHASIDDTAFEQARLYVRDLAGPALN